jgi:glycosyltransferase involved in cell wall biosynthesis/regulator of replication initiation timing
VTPRFTILLAVVRPPTLLPFAVESVLAQTVEEFELFVICDGAPVETIDCAREHARRDPRIKVLVFPKGERIGEAHLHNALLAASGRYVAHIEDDDLWFPAHLEEMEQLLRIADFGHLMHVWAKPNESIEMLPSNLARPEFRQRMLEEKFNRFGFSVCGYRLEAYRRLLPEGWAPGPKGLWPDLNMWRKFLRRDDMKFGTRMAVTALVLAGGFRAEMSLEERARESRKWLDRIFDEAERAKIIESAWRSGVNQQLQAECELSKLFSELSAMTTDRDRLFLEVSAMTTDRDRLFSEVSAMTTDRDRLSSELSTMTTDRDRLSSEASAMTTDRDRLFSELSAMTADRNRLSSETQRLQDKLSAVTTDRDRLSSETQPLQVKLSAVTTDRDRLSSETQRLKGELVAINQSTSWRLTEPLRRSAEFIRSIRGTVLRG